MIKVVAPASQHPHTMLRSLRFLHATVVTGVSHRVPALTSALGLRRLTAWRVGMVSRAYSIGVSSSSGSLAPVVKECQEPGCRGSDGTRY